MKEKEAKATIVEVIGSECPYCGKEYLDTEPGWRDKPQEDGKSFSLVRCQFNECNKGFRLDFNN